jgi:hypothetical protein
VNASSGAAGRSVWEWSDDAGVVVEQLAAEGGGRWRALVDRRPALGLERRWVQLPGEVEVTVEDVAAFAPAEPAPSGGLRVAGTPLAHWSHAAGVVVLRLERGEEGRWRAMVARRPGGEVAPRWVEVSADVVVTEAGLDAREWGGGVPGQVGLGFDAGGSRSRPDLGR